MQPDEARSVLGVPASATRQEIKAAYRRQVKTWHPDRQGTDEQRRARAEDAVRRVIAAYECLQGTTSASTFSVRRTAPNPAHPGRRSRRSRAGARRRRRRRAAAWISVTVAVGVLLASLGAWSIRRAVSPEPAEADAATTRAPGPPPEPVKVQRVGNEYPVHNPTKELWVGCLGWVGSKWFRIGAVGPGETVKIPSSNFDASLGPADTDRDMRVLCQPR